MVTTCSVHAGPAALSALPSGFGRIARSYPADSLVVAAGAAAAAGGMARKPPQAPQAPRVAAALHRHGRAATAAHVAAGVMAKLAEATRARAATWSRQRERRLTERALRRLGPSALRDLGMHASEISSLASEAAHEVEITRVLAWRGTPLRVV